MPDRRVLGSMTLHDRASRIAVVVACGSAILLILHELVRRGYL